MQNTSWVLNVNDTTMKYVMPDDAKSRSVKRHIGSEKVVDDIFPPKINKTCPLSNTPVAENSVRTTLSSSLTPGREGSAIKRKLSDRTPVKDGSVRKTRSSSKTPEGDASGSKTGSSSRTPVAVGSVRKTRSSDKTPEGVGSVTKTLSSKRTPVGVRSVSKSSSAKGTPKGSVNKTSSSKGTPVGQGSVGKLKSSKSASDTKTRSSQPKKLDFGDSKAAVAEKCDASSEEKSVEVQKDGSDGNPESDDVHKESDTNKETNRLGSAEENAREQSGSSLPEGGSQLDAADGVPVYSLPEECVSVPADDSGGDSPASSTAPSVDEVIAAEVKRLKQRRSTLGRGRIRHSLGGRQSLCVSQPLLSLDGKKLRNVIKFRITFVSCSSEGSSSCTSAVGSYL